MKQKTLSNYKNQKIRLYLNNGRIYTGKITSVSEDTCEIVDKFCFKVTISLEAIQHFEVIGEGGEQNGKQRF